MINNASMVNNSHASANSVGTMNVNFNTLPTQHAPHHAPGPRLVQPEIATAYSNMMQELAAAPQPNIYGANGVWTQHPGLFLAESETVQRFGEVGELERALADPELWELYLREHPNVFGA